MSSNKEQKLNTAYISHTSNYFKKENKTQSQKSPSHFLFYYSSSFVDWHVDSFNWQVLSSFLFILFTLVLISFWQLLMDNTEQCIIITWCLQLLISCKLCLYECTFSLANLHSCKTWWTESKTSTLKVVSVCTFTSGWHSL